MKRSQRLRQIGIGVQLKKLRENKAMTTRSVAAALGLSSSSISRTELGQRIPDREEVSALCALYGVTGEQKRELIERVGQTAETAAWLESGHISDDLASLMVLEREAVKITNVQTAVVPGLAQTADYTRLVLSNYHEDGDDLERRVATRLGRQGILSRPCAPTVTLLIAEGALHRTMGDPRSVRTQLEHLVLLQTRDNVSIRVVPFHGPQPAEFYAFSLYELADGQPYVVVEAPNTGIFITEPSETEPFVENSRMLMNCALSDEESCALVRKIAKGMHDE